MKRKWTNVLALTLVLILSIAGLPMFQSEVHAEEIIATVNGTIQTGTTSEILKLSTPQGNMEIKMDSQTDASGCKLLLPGKKIYVSVTHGNDGYLHAAKITTDSQGSSVTIENDTTTITATIKEKSTEEMLYVSTPQGDMELKMDTTTDVSGCNFLIVGKTYSIACARGSDAYMHAVRIYENGSYYSSSSYSSSSNSSYSGNPVVINTNGATASVSGEVARNTTATILYLDTDGGVMQFKLDDNTDVLRGMVHTHDNPLTVYYTMGNDGYLHAACIVGKRTSSNATVETSDTTTVNGTVLEKSTEDILYLDTPQGEMELKLDSVNSISGCKALITGKQITITCAYGSDAYMHVITVKG